MMQETSGDQASGDADAAQRRGGHRFNEAMQDGGAVVFGAREGEVRYGQCQM